MSVYCINECSQAMEKARQNKKIVEAIGEPIVRGPWYNASLAVNQKRHSVSCTCPISGPQGSGILKLKAVQSGGTLKFDNSFFLQDLYNV